MGREEELAEIHRQLSSGSGRVLLHGMGGLGKTTLARAYAARFAHAYDTVLWLNVRQDLTHTFCDDGELTTKTSPGIPGSTRIRPSTSGKSGRCSPGFWKSGGCC